MNQLYPMYKFSTRGWSRKASACAKFGLAAFAVSSLTACGSVSEMTQQRVKQSETVVQQAQQSIGQSEDGAVELQQAKEHLGAAQTALSNNREEDAGRFAQQAQLEAELAVAKSQNGHAQRAASEVSASLETLRQESTRTPITQ
jgi:hypothetical protein